MSDRSTSSRILLIAQPFAPHGGSHATRVNGLVEAFLDLGYEVDVLTTTVHRFTPGLDWALVDQVARAKAMRAFCGPLHYASYVINGLKSPGATRSALGLRVRKSVLIPDTYIEWVPFAIARLILSRLGGGPRPNLIISSATPYSSHLIALWAKALFRVPWIADFGDPWVIEPGVVRGALRRRLELAMERRVVQKADAITWATSTTQEAYQAIYPDKAKQMHVVYMGYRPEDYLARNAKRESKAVTLTYAGRINPEHRDSSRLLELISALNRLGHYQLQVAGADLEEFARSSAKSDVRNIVIMNSLPHLQFVDLLMSSDVLVLLGNRTPLQVPGKLFQYLGTGKPILYIKNMADTERDEIEEILSASSARYMIVRLEGDIDVQKVADFCSKGANQVSQNPSTLQHSWRHRALQMTEMIGIRP
jgi:glycosyltransferase involved in cell wall biosynthesis